MSMCARVWICIAFMRCDAMCGVFRVVAHEWIKCKHATMKQYQHRSSIHWDFLNDATNKKQLFRSFSRPLNACTGCTAWLQIQHQISIWLLFCVLFSFNVRIIHNDQANNFAIASDNNWMCLKNDGWIHSCSLTQNLHQFCRRKSKKHREIISFFMVFPLRVWAGV